MEKNKLTKMSDIIYYYKWHALAVIGAIILTILVVHECSTIVRDDVTINMLVSSRFEDSASEELSNAISEAAAFDDINGDGKHAAYVNVVRVPYRLTSEGEISSGMMATVALATDEALLNFVDGDLARNYANSGYFDDITAKFPASLLEGAEILETENGLKFGISVKGNSFLESRGINTKDMYACLRIPIEGYNEEKYEKKVKAAADVLKFIIDNK